VLGVCDLQLFIEIAVIARLVVGMRVTGKRVGAIPTPAVDGGKCSVNVVTATAGVGLAPPLSMTSPSHRPLCFDEQEMCCVAGDEDERFNKGRLACVLWFAPGWLVRGVAAPFVLVYTHFGQLIPSALALLTSFPLSTKPSDKLRHFLLSTSITIAMTGVAVAHGFREGEPCITEIFSIAVVVGVAASFLVKIICFVGMIYRLKPSKTAVGGSGLAVFAFSVDDAKQQGSWSVAMWAAHFAGTPKNVELQDEDLYVKEAAIAGLKKSANACTALSLGLHECQLTDVDQGVLETISCSANLERLDASGNAIGASAVSALAKRLAKNGAAFTHLNVKDTIAVETVGHITTFYAAAKDAVAAGRTCLVDCAIFEALADLPGGEEVKMSKRGLTDNDVWIVCELLTASCSRLQKIDLFGNQLTDVSGIALAKVLPQAASLIHISLSENKLGDGAGVALANALELNRNIKSVHLGANEMTDVSGVRFSEMLADPFCTIEELGLRHNKFTDKTGVALAKSITSNQSLQLLFARGNSFADPTGLAFADSLQSNTTLGELFLSENNLTSTSVVKLATALKSNATLKKLRLGKNQIDDVGAQALTEMLSDNTTLNWLTLGENSISDTAKETLTTSWGDRDGSVLFTPI
jgi:Ran GTPase-activating protein (RanGAP) involved in mRNA processing and transport